MSLEMRPPSLSMLANLQLPMKNRNRHVPRNKVLKYQMKTQEEHHKGHPKKIIVNPFSHPNVLNIKEAMLIIKIKLRSPSQIVKFKITTLSL
jgi:hypothetical protein